MRVVIVSNLFSPHVIGGYEIGCLNLARAAQKAGHETYVLTSLPVGRLVKGVAASDLNVRPIFEPIFEYEKSLSGVPIVNEQAKFGGIVPANVMAFQNELKAIRPDAIWIFNPLGLGPVGIVETAVGSGIPTTIHLMDHLDQTIAGYQYGFYQLPRWSRAKNKMGAISCSTKTLNQNQLYGNYQRSCVIPNGVVLPEQMEHKTKRRDPSEPLQLVYFGQINKRKGILQLVEALSGFRQQHPQQEVVLHFIGGVAGEFEGLLQSRIKQLGLEPNIKFHGFCQSERLEALIDQMDLAVFPLSPEEPFAYVVIEAIRAGLPIIVTKEAGCAEFLPKDYPLLLHDRDNVQELAGLLTAFVERQDELDDWCSQLQAAVYEYCDLDRKCLPRCIDFLAGGEAESLEFDQDLETRLESCVSSSLANWYSSEHLEDIFILKWMSKKKSVGRKLETWIRSRIPASFRYKIKRSLRRISGRRAG